MGLTEQIIQIIEDEYNSRAKCLFTRNMLIEGIADVLEKKYDHCEFNCIDKINKRINFIINLYMENEILYIEIYKSSNLNNKFKYILDFDNDKILVT